MSVLGSRFLNLIVSFILVGIISVGVSASVVNNQSSNCADLIMLFARGSSSNPNGVNLDIPFSNDFEEGMPDPSDPTKKIGAEEIPGSFFRWMEKRLVADYPHINYKAISIHNSGNMWSANGYPAVGIFGPSTVNNIFDAELFWWPAGEYRGSVRSGMDELKGQVNYEVTRCPNQRIVIGGYSQGANVVGDALFEIPKEQRNLIDSVALFGDPKFISAQYNKYNLFDDPKVYPWHRGTAGLRERGINDARIPYVPDDMKYKTISWCHEDDFVCTGFSGLGWGITNHELPSNTNSIWQGAEGALGDGHTRYPVFGVPEATEEILANLRSHLSALEIERGGLDPKLDSFRKTYDGTLKNNHPVDLMFALNNTSGIEDAQAQYYQKLKGIINQYKNNFTDMTTGSILYTDLAGGSGADKSSVAAYTQKPNQLSTNTDSMFAWSPYLYGGPGGGGDYPENHGMAIERGGMFAGWRKEAKKHFVIFAERPAQGSYSFDMCNSSIVSVLPHTGELPCVSGKQFETISHPEWCVNIYHTLAGATCPYIGTASSNKIISRTLEDAVMIAQAKGFTVDIIQPHTARNNQPDYTPTYVSDQLKNLAESTGGLYLKYDIFGEAELRNAVWQILNHEPTNMSLRQHQPGSLLAFDDATIDFAPLTGLAKIPANTPTLLTVSPVSGAQSYGWDTNSDGVDDKTSDGPSAEISINESLEKFIRVTAYQTPTGTTRLSTVSIPFELTDAVADVYVPGDAAGLVDLVVSREAGQDELVLTWDSQNYSRFDIVIIKDPLSGVPIATVPATNASYTFDPGLDFGDKIVVQLVSGGSEADPQTIDVTTIYPLPPVEPTPNTDLQDPENPFDTPPIDDLIIIIDDPVPPIEPIIVNELLLDTDTPFVADPTGNVGQTDDKIVTQKEPTTTLVLSSTCASCDPPYRAVLSAYYLPPTPSSSPLPTYSSAPTTVVASAQDVKTNPQGEVGDQNAVKELFPEVGTSEPQVDVKESWSKLWLLVPLPLVIAFFAWWLIFAKNRKDNDDK